MIRASIVGGSGYVGGELLRLLLFHPSVSVEGVSSESFTGKPIGRVHPNLRGFNTIRFQSLSQMDPADVVFMCLPHGEASKRWNELEALAPKVIDLSADFRLQDAEVYERYYGGKHLRPELLSRFVYGIPELKREMIRSSSFVSSGGCNATAAILGLYPLFAAGIVSDVGPVIEVKVGSSEAGRKPSATSHHPERSGSVRAFAPTGHRHTAEIAQALETEVQIPVHLSVTSVEMVRGAVATSHVFPNCDITEREVWDIFREAFNNEPFLRLVKERRGPYRYPEPKILSGTNYCDVGFDLDPNSKRLVIVSAIDNLVKGAAGQAIQCMNLMTGLDELTGLAFSGLHPI